MHVCMYWFAAPKAPDCGGVSRPAALSTMYTCVYTYMYIYICIPQTRAFPGTELSRKNRSPKSRAKQITHNN